MKDGGRAQANACALPLIVFLYEFNDLVPSALHSSGGIAADQSQYFLFGAEVKIVLCRLL